ncbi:4-hydroxybutyrate CoA-transferase [Propionigenium maris DSM 9537]|uniref:4-hydroxybutyrate CoA-transferase n=1 Tax=Propionigenium maris DSM 9537 TaxID=1123000 RepID=A0A9W6LP04_9FUSO|nr:acetyl-CoA hydrolase/transferase C-terminal domain-containing protein [Propionigenium maris]GLI57092.1 4-hydroxybutyrate CoA-transferase [Propionigenium maris DSM 9537]
MDWNNVYREKIVSPTEAISKINSGDRIVVSHACAEPKLLVDSLVKNREKFTDLEIVHMVAMGKAEYVSEGMENHFKHNAIFAGASTRKAVQEGRADFTTCYFHEVPKLFKEGMMPVDVAMIQVTPPDKHGNCSVGVSVDYTKPAAESAKLLIAQMNDKMPRTMGDSFIHISDIDYIVEHSEDLTELQPPKLGDVEREIGRNCADLIEDGSTLQLGIGAIPDAVLLFLKDKKDLGIHSEMISDGVLELIREGVITNKCKTLHKGKSIVTFLMGTRKLYDYVHDNPAIEFYPVDYVNDPLVIAQNEKMISINSCIQIDLTGQICSESIGEKQVSGVGGQVDFVRGATMSRGGKSIIAIPSTAAKGKVSRIVPALDRGAIVTTSRNDVDYVVTEYGIARLKGKTLKERGRDLIKISHPDFRESLIDEWKKIYKCEF